jgi:8-amino-7-oxononanoate synthase
VIDMTRALYLGLTHGSSSLRPWASLTRGRPAVLGDASVRVGERLAVMLGVERVSIAPSTLHVVTDLYAALPARVRTIHVDGCAYAVTRWGLERARLRGVAVHRFSHPDELEHRVEPGSAIVTDAMCMRCRCIKPLRRLAALAERTGGVLVVDDSQGLGVLGDAPSPRAPFGHGGAGTTRWCEAATPHTIVIGSLAKGLGVPLALLGGDASWVRWFERNSQTRVHASPSSAAHLAALGSALDTLERHGDRLRTRLLDRIHTFRAHAGPALAPGVFPVQSTTALPEATTRALRRRLAAHAVQAIALPAGPHEGRIAFIVTAAHDREALADAGRVLAEQWRALHGAAA